MSLFNAFQRSIFKMGDMVACRHCALGALPEAGQRLAEPLELMELESRILLSGVPPGGDALVQEAFDGAVPAGGDVQVVEADNQIAYSQTIQIEPRDRLIAKFAIAHSSTNVANRLVAWGLTETGWGPFVQDNILPALEAGFTRIELHNPFGRGPGDRSMAFDQYLDAQVDTPKLAEDFAKYWKPITDSGIEVIGYIGSPHTNAEQVALIDDPTAWWDRALAAVQPLVDAGMSIGLDASANEGPDSLDAALAQHLRDQGVRVYVEARPAATSTQWFDYPIMVLLNTWDSQSPEVNPGKIGKHAWEYELTGEVIRIIRANFGEDVDVLKDVLAQGHTVTLNWRPDWPLKVGDTTLDEVLEGVGITSLPTRIGLQSSNAGADPLTYAITSGPSHGSLTVHPQNDALVTYLPAPYYSGTDAFTFQVTDDQGRSETATVSLNIRGFTPPPAPSRPITPAIASDAPIRVREIVDAQVGLRQGEVSMIPAELVYDATGPVRPSLSRTEVAADGFVSAGGAHDRYGLEQLSGVAIGAPRSAASHSFGSLLPAAGATYDAASLDASDSYLAMSRSTRKAPLAAYARDVHRWSADHDRQPGSVEEGTEGVASLPSAERRDVDTESAVPLFEEVLGEDAMLPDQSETPAATDRDA
ncbi:MAG: Ig-like domain-containing protein, partial [Pirellulales bacterium]